MSGCDSCFTEQKSIDQAVNTARAAAKAFAVKHGCCVFVYFDEFRQPQYMKESAAIAAGIQPTLGVITQYQPVHEPV